MQNYKVGDLVERNTGFLPTRQRIDSLDPNSVELVRVNDLPKQEKLGRRFFQENYQFATWRSSPWTKIGLAVGLLALVIAFTLIAGGTF